MNIIKAYYGGADCTKELSHKIKGKHLLLYANNNIIGDPLPDVEKQLEIFWSYNNQEFFNCYDEGDLVVLPKLQGTKLGVFYSNNNGRLESNSIINASLKSIKEAAKGENVDIITCPWYPIPNNPFIEIESQFKIGGFSNIILQILQCLNTAQAMNPNYKYVSFLEHDLLYPKGIFDYPDSENTLVNTNYIGMCKKGFQTKQQNDYPLSQLTMPFNRALKHFESIFHNALIYNAGLVEPNTDSIIEWECKYPAVHINYGGHFTSHYNVYSATDTFSEYPYWGDMSQYDYFFTKK